MTQFERKLSHTSLSSFRRCKMRYKWGYIDNHAALSSPAQIKGGVGHVGLGAWYTSLSEMKDTRIDVDDARAIALKAASNKLSEYEREVAEEMTDMWDDIAIILERYFKWAIDADDFQVQEIEYKFELEIDDFILIGYLDGIVQRIDGTLWILEHKFTKQARVKHLELDAQLSLYMLAARASGFDVRGALYNVIRTTLGGIAATEPVVRLPVYRNNEGLQQIAREIVLQMKEMRTFHEQNGEGAYRNQTMDCSWDCSFFNPCLAMNDDGDPTPALQLIPIKEYKK